MTDTGTDLRIDDPSRDEASPSRVRVGGLRVAAALHAFVEREALPGTAMTSAEFWAGVERIVADLDPRTRALLEERDRLQAEIDERYRELRGSEIDPEADQRFLERIGYLLPKPEGVVVTTERVAVEIAELAGPQLVVPVTNARYALNAANARWGSLYDAFYGTDILPGRARPGGYDPDRGAEVVAAVRELLDEFFPLSNGSHHDAIGYRVEGGALSVRTSEGAGGLADPDQFRAFAGPEDSPEAVVLRRHGLHWELRFDAESPIADADPAGVSDVIIESALTTIVDFEDSVAAVDAADKVVAYRNWLGLNRGDLVDTFEKSGRTVTRRLADDRRRIGADGREVTLPGRALMLVRNVGHLMTTDAVLDADGHEIGEGLLDAVITALCALPGLEPRNPHRNGGSGTLVIVKPKLHGPAEVALTVELFGRVEKLLALPSCTLQLGLMDEERRTSANLAACIAEASTRLVFINTGFLDRSGDEIHTAMEAGPIVRKADLRAQPWITAYEDRNVDIGLAAGLPGRAQIGKGMWAMPDLMGDMLEQKVAHPMSGASTAWVPSPTAATVHALHYLRVDVRARQQALASRPRTPLSRLLTVPVGDPTSWSAPARQEEVDLNVQSLLGYVVRWVDQGVGCSKVPDIHDVGLMEDRATLRISSQLLANWLRHGVVSEDQVLESMHRMAAVVDRQNADDPVYRPLTVDPASNIAFQAALDLVFHGAEQPNGYTEPILHRRRREVKAQVDA